jgi:hypothetical protein
MLLLLRCRLYVQGEPLAVIPPTSKRLKSCPSDQNRTAEPTSRRQLQGRLAGLIPRARFRMPANTPGGRHPQRSPGFFFSVSSCCNPDLVGCGTRFWFTLKKNSVAHPVCLSRIRIFSIPDPNFSHPGSRIRIKEFKYFNPKNCFLALGNMIRGCSSWIRILTFYLSRIRIRNSGKKAELSMDLWIPYPECVEKRWDEDPV